MERSGLTEPNSNQIRNARASANGGGCTSDASLSGAGGGGDGGSGHAGGGDSAGNSTSANNAHDQPQVSGPGADTPASSPHANKRNGKPKSKESLWDQAKIRIGPEYQAVCPPLIVERQPEALKDREWAVWAPVKDIPEKKLDDYIAVARDKHGYSVEQALSMLFWHNHDIERAINDLKNYMPRPDEWTAEDKTRFEQAFQYHGKNFRHISQMLPDKSVAQVVRYYYSWKMLCERSSAMDRPEENLSTVVDKEGSGDNNEGVGDNKENGVGNIEDGAGGGANSVLTEKFPSVGDHLLGGIDEDDDALSNSKDDTTSSSLSTSGTDATAASTEGYCDNCGVTCYKLYDSPHGRFCGSCHNYWRRTGNKRLISGPVEAPTGMYLNHDLLLTLSQNQDNFLAWENLNIARKMEQVQASKQEMEILETEIDELEEATDSIDVPSSPERYFNKRWTKEEKECYTMALLEYGKNFQAMSVILGTKTVTECRSFYSKQRNRMNLDSFVKQYEAKQKATATAAGTSMVVDGKESETSSTTTVGIDGSNEPPTTTSTGRHDSSAAVTTDVEINQHELALSGSNSNSSTANTESCLPPANLQKEK